MLAVISLSQVRHQNFQVGFSKCFPKADPSTTIEGCIATWATFLGVTGQTEWMAVVKSFGEELVGSLPFITVSVQTVGADSYVVTFLELVPTKFHVFQANIGCHEGSWRLKPQCFVHHLAQELQVLSDLVSY